MQTARNIAAADGGCAMSSPEDRTVRVLGIAGWKNSGKTTLAARLIEELTKRGLRVAAVKHSHHDIELDAEDTDSARPAQAGRDRWPWCRRRWWGIRREIAGGEKEPDLVDVIAALGPADIVLVEGYKRATISKIEVRRTEARSHEPLAGPIHLSSPSRPTIWSMRRRVPCSRSTTSPPLRNSSCRVRFSPV